jgi:hypothetical protein
MDREKHVAGMEEREFRVDEELEAEGDDWVSLGYEQARWEGNC